MKNDGSVSFECDLPNDNPLITPDVLKYSYKNGDGELQGYIRASDLEVEYFDRTDINFVSKIRMSSSKYETLFKTTFKSMDEVTLTSHENVFKVNGEFMCGNHMTSIITSNENINVHGPSTPIVATYNIGMLQKCICKLCDSLEMKFQDNKMLWIQFLGCDHLYVEYLIAPKEDISDD